MSQLRSARDGGQHKATCIDNGGRIAERAKEKQIDYLTYR